VWGDWGERADWQTSRGPKRHGARERERGRERERERSCRAFVCSRSASASNLFHPCQPAVPKSAACLSVCLSVASSPSQQRHFTTLPLSTHDNIRLTRPHHARFHPPRCLTSLPTYNLIHSAAHDSTVSPRAPPPLLLPSTPITARITHYPRDLPSTTASLSSQSGIHHSSHSPTRTRARTTQR
jgi:hypothetical protein